MSLSVYKWGWGEAGKPVSFWGWVDTPPGNPFIPKIVERGFIPGHVRDLSVLRVVKYPENFKVVKK